MYKRAEKKGNKKRPVDREIKNEGTLEDLQKIADEIYEVICNTKVSKEPSMKEKYGGYEIRTLEEAVNNKEMNKEKEDLYK